MKFRNPNPQEEKQKQSALEMLETDRVRLLMDQPFVGAILIRQNLIPVVDSRCPTAATDGQNIFVNPYFYLKFNPGERRFLLAHEVWHTVYLHFLRRGGRERNLFNVATDMEINHMLHRERFRIPPSARMPPDAWRDLNAEEVYERLLKQRNPPEDSKFDVHLEPRSAMSEEPDPEEEEQIIDPDFQVDFGPAPEDRAREKVIAAAVQYEKLRGTLPSHLSRVVEKYRAGKLPWRELLAQFVTSCFGGSRRWLPPNRRYISSGLYLQSRRDTLLQAVLAIDTSGSTSGDLARFASELVNLLDTFGQYELTVICCDAKVQSVETYTAYKPFDAGKITFKGGGGTSFKPVFRYVGKNLPGTQLLMYFTDGEGDLPDKPSYPVMWVITPEGENRIPWGYEVTMDS